MATNYNKKDVVPNPNPRIGSGSAKAETTHQPVVTVGPRGGCVGGPKDGVQKS